MHPAGYIAHIDVFESERLERTGHGRLDDRLNVLLDVLLGKLAHIRPRLQDYLIKETKNLIQ